VTSFRDPLIRLTISLLALSACQHAPHRRSPASLEVAHSLEEAMSFSSDMMNVYSVDPEGGVCSADQMAGAARSTHFSTTACESMMKRIYADKQADVRLVIGYLDTRPTDPTWDNRYRDNFVKSFKKACVTGGTSLCGFVPDPMNSDRLLRRMGDGRIVRLTITDSSVTASDDSNRVDSRQTRKTDLRNLEFVDAIKNGEVVIYMGHSRDGGGPDFGPPRLTAEEHVDYDWYHRNKPGLKRLVSALGADYQTTDRLDLFGSLSCSSVMHFKKRVNQAAPDTSYLGTSRLSTFGEVEKMARLALEKIVTRSCDIENSMQQSGLPGQFFPDP